MQAHSDVAEALDRLRELGAVRRPDDQVLGEFLSLYYFELPEEDVDDRKIDDIYAVGVAHLDLGRQRGRSDRRSSGSISPDRERDGWQSPHSVVLMVTDDMPFLVDTTRMVLERHGLDIHLLVHPMLPVERDARPRDATRRTVQRRWQRQATSADRRGVDPDRDRPRRRRHRRGARGGAPGRRSPTCVASSTTSCRCATGCWHWCTSTRRCTGSLTGSSSSSAPSTRSAARTAP